MTQNDNNRESMIPSTMRIVFGVIMIIVYVGMGILLLINFFDWGDTPVWTWFRWIGGILLIIYDNSGASTARFDIFYNKSEIKFSPIERIVKLTLTIFANSKATGHTEIEQAVALDNI